jgi:hypothetical protein
MAFCSGCGEAYAPDYSRRRGNRTYCEVCRGAKIPERDASRDYRRRERAPSQVT